MNNEMLSKTGSPNDTIQVTKTNHFRDFLLQSGIPVLETYSNVHRGSGFNSMVTTCLYEKAREITLEYLGFDKKEYTVLFCTNQRTIKFENLFKSGSYKILSSSDFGLKLGVYAIAVNRKQLPESIPFIAGGGTTKLYSRKWIIPANVPDRFEAGTPAIINIILFAKALLMIRKWGKDIFRSGTLAQLNAGEILNKDNLNDLSGRELLSQLRENLIGKNLLVPTTEGPKPFINLDNSASTRTFEPIWNAFSNTLFQREDVQKEVVANVKAICSNFLNARQSEYDVLFTSNTTESINLVAENMVQDSDVEEEPVILISTLEHSSNDLPWRSVPGHSVVWLPVDKEGFWDLSELEQQLGDYNRKGIYGKKRIKFVAVSGASNVLGSCNNLNETSRLAHKYGAKILVDGAQLIAHRKVDISAGNFDFFAFSAHKVYAPFGTGVLVARKGTMNLEKETLARIIASGEENAAGIAALGKSLLILNQIGFDIIEKEEQKLVRLALSELQKIPKLKVPGISSPDSPKMENKMGVVVFGFDEMMAGKIAKKLALQAGIGIRYGCHCAHLIVKYLSGFTPFLEQFQRMVVLLVPPLKLQGFARVSFGIENTENDIKVLSEELNKISIHFDKQSKKTISKHVESSKAKLKTAEMETTKRINDISLKVYAI